MKETKTNAMRLLDRENVEYRVIMYSCDIFTDGAHVAGLIGEPPEKVYKTLVTVGRSGNYYVFVIPVAEELDLKKASSAAGEKSLGLIHVSEINKVTGYIRGGCTAIGMKKQYKTYIDSSAMSLDKIVVSGGRVGIQIELSPDDLKKYSMAEYAMVTALQREEN